MVTLFEMMRQSAMLVASFVLFKIKRRLRQASSSKQNSRFQENKKQNDHADKQHSKSKIRQGGQREQKQPARGNAL